MTPSLGPECFENINRDLRLYKMLSMYFNKLYWVKADKILKECRFGFICSVSGCNSFSCIKYLALTDKLNKLKI